MTGEHLTMPNWPLSSQATAGVLLDMIAVSGKKEILRILRVQIAASQCEWV